MIIYWNVFLGLKGVGAVQHIEMNEIGPADWMIFLVHDLNATLINQLIIVIFKMSHFIHLL